MTKVHTYCAKGQKYLTIVYRNNLIQVLWESQEVLVRPMSQTNFFDTSGKRFSSSEVIIKDEITTIRVDFSKSKASIYSTRFNVKVSGETPNRRSLTLNLKPEYEGRMLVFGKLNIHEIGDNPVLPFGDFWRATEVRTTRGSIDEKYGHGLSGTSIPGGTGGSSDMIESEDTTASINCMSEETKKEILEKLTSMSNHIDETLKGISNKKYRVAKVNEPKKENFYTKIIHNTSLYTKILVGDSVINIDWVKDVVKSDLFIDSNEYWVSEDSKVSIAGYRLRIEIDFGNQEISIETRGLTIDSESLKMFLVQYIKLTPEHEASLDVSGICELSVTVSDEIESDYTNKELREVEFPPSRWPKESTTVVLGSIGIVATAIIAIVSLL